MTEIEAVNERHSVRSYQDRKIEPQTVGLLKEFIEKCNAEGNLHLQFVEDAGSTFNRMLNKFMGLGSAPSVIACIGNSNDTLDERIGYYGEKVVLYAQTLGLNTCWAGTFNSKNVNAEIKPGERLAIVIAVGYGTNGGRPHKSKPIEKVVRGGIENKPDWFIKGAECALAAPTAVNQQKFEIVLNDGGTVEILDKGGVLSGIDKGIVKYHFEIGSGHPVK